SSGILYALGAAASFSAYMLASSRIVPKTQALTNAAWVALGASLSLLTQGVLLGGMRAPGSSWWLMVLNGVATAAAFGFMFAALKRLGASRTAVVMTLEAASAVVLAALLLGERLAFVQLIGGAAILAATVLIARMKTVVVPLTVEEP
ncbi:MAG: EamA family transporter, partial [Acidimicrobiales bacterium]